MDAQYIFLNEIMYIECAIIHSSVTSTKYTGTELLQVIFFLFETLQGPQ
jgi:hypothetical protein